ncbi:DUF3050 domain-containing protein [Lysobacter sp. SG-8]|uniref:DUF3050 domain-containing protein n=1 Tax=Marilutibacter penaei TaxID=2759900 RepID=A0A7W3U2W3_9GAMM|nr:DUF3050 domain-containing protein [Lysobacter penaei]MBB1087942.1 DUF3050 domain-containing protein [Lysobacter penaei]
MDVNTNVTDGQLDAVPTERILALRQGLECHPVFAELRDIHALRAFMQVHVFAVWDFMTLVKRLQRDLTCVTLPWMPPADAASARLINDIVLAEESDIDRNGVAASHMDLYLEAMADVGASTRMFDGFLALLRDGVDCDAALDRIDVPDFVRAFVRDTLATAHGGTTLQVMASFLYGRENVIPGMFQGLLDRWSLNVSAAPGFVYYLERHIELDADEHGPAAARMIGRLLARHPDGLAVARESAEQALVARHRLWDGTAAMLRRTLAPTGASPGEAPVPA